MAPCARALRVDFIWSHSTQCELEGHEIHSFARKGHRVNIACNFLSDFEARREKRSGKNEMEKTQKSKNAELQQGWD